MIPSNRDTIVLVTGVNGYIAAVIGRQLLEAGYTVRGVSRSKTAKDRLLLDAFRGYDDQYQHFEVKDITVPGAFDEAVQGVYSIVHTASPVDFSLTTVDAFFIPAVEGNLSILNSAKSAAGPQLKSFVLTSSISAAVDKWKQPPDHAYTEEDWNTSGEAVARTQFSGPVAYGASKALSEKAMWDWVKANKPTFACAAINPAVVKGPPVTWPDGPEGLNETLRPLWAIYSGEAKTMPPPIGMDSYIDVRDVAALHVWAALHPEDSNGQRYLATNGKAPPQAMADVLRREFPEREILVGEPGKGYVKDTYWFPEGEASAIATKAHKALGVDRFTGFEKSILDTVEAFEERWPGRAKNLKQ